MPEGDALKKLPPELPKEYRDFVACTRDTLEVPPGPLTWAKIPGVPDNLKPSATFERGDGGAVKVTISVMGLSLQVDISVTKRGNLKADTSTWPIETPFIGDKLKELADGVGKWVDDLNADFRKNGKKLGGLSVADGKLIGSKVALAPKGAMLQPSGTGGTGMFAGARFPAAGAATGLVITTVSAGVLLFGGGPPVRNGTFVLPPIADPVTITGTLASTDIDLEVTADISSNVAMTVPRGGGPVEGSAQIVFEAVSSQGATFESTSDLDRFVAAYDPRSGDLIGAARHNITGVSGGQTQSREGDPLLFDATLAADGTLSGAFDGNGFSYPTSGSATDDLDADASAGNLSNGAAFDAAALDRPDAAETVADNRWFLAATDGNVLSGAGVLVVTYDFDHESFGAGCTFEGLRVADLSGTFDPATGAISGTSTVLAWGHPGETCNFEAGLAVEEATASGTLDLGTGEFELSIDATENVDGPFAVSGAFDRALFGAAQEPGSPLPWLGIGIGGALLLGSGAMLALGNRAARREGEEPAA